MEEGISDGSQQEDRHNEQGKRLIGESSGLFDEFVKVEKCCNHLVQANPDTDPRVEGEERNVEPLGKVVTDGLERQNWTGSSVDHLWVRGTKTETCQHGDQCWQRPINQRFENVPLAVQKPKSRKFRTRQ